MQLAAARQKTFDAQLGFSAQRNGKFGRTRLIALRPMAREAPARACRSSPSGCCLFLSSSLVSRRCCFYAPFVSLGLLSRRCIRAATGSAGRHHQEAAGSKPNAHARATDRPPARPPARPPGRPTDRPNDDRSVGRPHSLRTKSRTTKTTPWFSRAPPTRVISNQEISTILTAPSSVCRFRLSS